MLCVYFSAIARCHYVTLAFAHDRWKYKGCMTTKREGALLLLLDLGDHLICMQLCLPAKELHIPRHGCH